MEAKFYKHDSYLEIRRKFTGAWENLRLEIHRQSLRFHKEGDDEFETNARFYPLETENELLFTLYGKTTKAAAQNLFADFYCEKNSPPRTSSEACIYGNFPDKVYNPPETGTLDECNNPFYLPLNKYIYADFKRRFTERWTNLSVEVYPSDFQAGEMPPDAVELADVFEMTNLTCVNRLVRHDYYERNGFRDVIEKLANESILRDDIYLADFETSLRNSGIFVRVKNKRFGIYWERSLNCDRLKDFQTAEFSESLEQKTRKLNCIFL